MGKKTENLNLEHATSLSQQGI